MPRDMGSKSLCRGLIAWAVIVDREICTCGKPAGYMFRVRMTGIESDRGGERRNFKCKSASNFACRNSQA